MISCNTTKVRSELLKIGPVLTKNYFLNMDKIEPIIDESCSPNPQFYCKNNFQDNLADFCGQNWKGKLTIPNI